MCRLVDHKGAITMTVLEFRALPAKTVALMFFLAFPALGQTTVEDSVFSPSLGRTKHFLMMLPEGYVATQRYPALILLHGYTGNYRSWFESGRVAAEVRGLPLIVVSPDGENSWYVNSASEPKAKFEDYMLNDVLGKIKKAYPVDSTRIAIGGLSMGGYGALVLALRHPDVFSFVAGLSSSLDIPEGIPELERRNRQALRPSLDTALGDHATEQWKKYSLFGLIEQLDSARAPYVYLANGIQDEFEVRLYLHRQFADALRRHHMAYEYHETPGKHNGEYWDREIHGVLYRLSQLWRLVPEGNHLR